MKNQKSCTEILVEWICKNNSNYVRMRIGPTREVWIYGPPGCGKTMLAKDVAHTVAVFICVVGSEFVQKYLDEGRSNVLMLKLVLIVKFNVFYLNC